MALHRIKTEISRSDIFAGGLDFSVLCSKVPEESELILHPEIWGPTIARLDGFAVTFANGSLAELPGDDAMFDLFDSRDGHVNEAYTLLRDYSEAIDRIFDFELSVACSRIVMLEKLHVQEECRGNQLGLRLMREARQVFDGMATLSILCASPDGNNIDDDNRRALAQYYKRDPILGLVELDDAKRAGWMVGWWQSDYGNEADGMFVDLTARGSVAPNG